MAYKFTFDISKLPKELFDEISNFCENKMKIIKTNNIACKLVKKFQIDKYTGLSFDESKTLIEDIIDIQIKNCIFPIGSRDDNIGFAAFSIFYLDSYCFVIFHQNFFNLPVIDNLSTTV